MSANRIHVKGECRYEEAKAGAASIKPGMLARLDSAGELVVAGGTEGDFAAREVVLENALVGGLVSTVYDNDTQIPYGVFAPGSEAYMLIKSGQNVAKGDRLIAAGDGHLMREAGADSATVVKQVIAQAMEACDATSAAALCKVRFM
jgi:hypothetical protein